MTRYLEIAENIARLINDGVLRPGDRLPSVRDAALQRKVSKGTVIQAYALLETQGLVEALPKSGYYVKARLVGLGLLPQAGLSRPSIVKANSRARVRDALGDLVGAKVTSLGSSFPDASLFPMQNLNRALAATSRQGSYAKTLVDLQLGLPSLRRAIAQRYLELGYAVPMDEIIITCGGMEAISLSLQAVARHGDLVVIDSPMFFSGLQLLRQLGLNAVEMPTDPASGMDLGVLDATLKRHKVAACLLMTNCQNPLGFSMEEGKKRELAKLLRQHGVPLVENDVYAELQFSSIRNRAAKAFDTDGSVLHCGSFTKCLAPGFKIGWVAAGRYREAIANRKFATTLGTSFPPQAAISHYLLHYAYEKHLRQLRHTLAERTKLMAEAVFRYFPEGTRLSQPDGGFLLWVQMPAAVDSFKLFELAATHEIGIAPGPIFSTRANYKNFIRLNCSHPWSESLDRTVRWLSRAVSEMSLSH
ncbi:aminotransferase-like domain-containing protein [Candidimonas nitroreducens]|uniref:HTH-type transcriptional regulator NorG n=1 Tax=Candidimonas nitroreducens TaxID=683354 RepID=A0A225MLW6_9BURK|nr:PLP-dependent aminotransferase family protein [Candidimonas nitroreducens]OWT61962.1 GntR family transcriptional regulator [Candidimonas nitroreducens]